MADVKNPDPRIWNDVDDELPLAGTSIIVLTWDEHVLEDFLYDNGLFYSRDGQDMIWEEDIRFWKYE